jgi:hypothetical protein
VEEEEENEVEELDSLGRLHNELANADSSQEHIGTSRAGEAEVNPSTSDLETLGQRKTQRVVRKVPFSHPAAHLDKNLSLKITEHEVTLKSKTRSSSGELFGVLPYEPPSHRVRTQEQLSPTPSCLRAGQLNNQLRRSNPDYKTTSPSSDESCASQIPTFNINHG